MLLRALREDAGELPPMRTRQWKQVLPVEEYRRRAREDYDSVEDVVLRPEYEAGTEPEYESLVPNTSQFRKVSADEVKSSTGSVALAEDATQKRDTHCEE